MYKYPMEEFPKLKEGDIVLYMNQYSNNVTTCAEPGCTICVIEMINGYAGYIRDGIFHFGTRF